MFCPLSGKVHYLKWRLTKYFVDCVDIFHTYAEMENDEHIEVQLKFLVSQYSSDVVTTPKVVVQA